jgi:YD repeat-containing protein
MKLFSVCDKSILIVLLFFANTNGFSQSLYPPKIESPNAASLGKFGEVPVNLFTGTPDISIPLYTLSYGKINVPIALRYNAASVKPGQQPGWVGSGWDLESIGSISRQVRGALDEFYIDGTTGNAIGPNISYYFPYPGQTVTPGSDLANQPNWNTQSQLVYDFTHQTTVAGIDVEADEFSFNVMGHNGKFYYSGSSKGWQVVSDEDIKVEITGFVTPTNIRSAISQFTFSGSVVTSVNQSRMFGGFILTVPDGTKYYFGDVNNSGYGEGIEFSSQFMPHDASGNGNATPEFVANTWLLEKIVDANNNVVNFSYQRKYATCNLNLGFFELNASCQQNSVTWPAFIWGYAFGVPMIGNSATYSSDYVHTDQHFGMFQWPMYLTNISCANENISFSFSDASCSRYTNNQIYYRDLSNTTGGGFYADNMLINLNPQYIQWEKLDKISITDNPGSVGLYSTTPNKIKQFSFTYLNTASQRLMLGGLQFLDKQNNAVEQYQFNYNSDFITQNPNLYADGNFSDHWGYFNNTDLSLARFSDIYTRKQPNSQVATTELLNKITYPTGGYSSFTWEPNDYSFLVSLDRQSLISPVSAISPLSGSGGGCRIAEIKNCLSDGSVITDKKYYYKRNYTAGANPSLLNSSGILNGTPQYTFSLTNRIGVLGYTINNYQATSLVGTQNYSYAGNGSPIGYDEVNEVNIDGSFTKALFTNYGNDYNNISHFDKIPTGYLGWIAGSDTYFPMSSLELERGKPVATFQYKSDNTLLQKTVITYRNDNNRFNSSVNLINLNASSGSPDCIDALVLASAHSVFNYSYYPINKTITTYNQNGTNPIIESENYTAYNSSNLLQAKNTINSKGETIYTNYTYPTDYTSTPYTLMVTPAHILNPIIQSAVSNNVSPVSQIMKNYSQPFTGIFVPQNLQIKVGANTPEIREQINLFDAKGNPLEIQKPMGVKEVYIWGCNSQYIMARIVGSTGYTTASSLVNLSTLNQAGMGTGVGSLNDADVRTELNKLRTGLPNALVTTYTYACGIGITSETDPAGRTIYYNYDNFGRLSYLQDQDKNIIKKFCYNYAGQPENCNSTGFSNQQSYTGTFTSNAVCAAGTTSQTYTYTVPIGSYFSFVSQADAEQLAQNALNTNGQTIANSLPCLAAIGYLNTSSMPYTVVFTNTLTGVAYTFSAYPNTVTSTLGSIPVGYYNITMTPYGATTSTLTFNGNTYTNPPFSFTNININTANNFSIQNAPSSGPCSFTMATGYSSPTNSISSNGTTANGYLVFYSTTTTLSQGNNYQIATINGGCVPSGTRSFTTSAGGRNWTVTIYSNGQMFVQMAYGSAPLTPGSSVSINLSYSL